MSDATGVDTPVTTPSSAEPTFDEGRRWWWAELLAVLELGGLAAFAFARPVLDTFGRSPETFVARGANAVTVVLFGLVVALVPCGVLGLLGLLGRPFGSVVRRRAHLVLVAVAGGFAVWQLGQGITGYPPDSQKLIVAGVIGGVALGFLRASVASTASFLRFLGAASVVFLVQFLFMSPTSGLLSGGPTVDDEVARAVAADLGDDPPDVVVLVFDELPTVSLLDGQGNVDAELYPNFARLAGMSTWYRNNTTVAAFTTEAVPALLTGRLGASLTASDAGGDENLFTLLAGSYEMHVQEQVTRLCPDEACPDLEGDGLWPLLGDAFGTWSGTIAGEDEGDMQVPRALKDTRLLDAEAWRAGLRAVTDRPQFEFHHLLLPHAPWLYDDRGDPYVGSGFTPAGQARGTRWTASGVEVGTQRHVLQVQAVDRFLGESIDRLEADGRLDDTLLVVTSDHGSGFLADQPQRPVTEENLEHVLWTPLFVKAPGQAAGAVDDGNVMSIDVVPTIAHHLGIDLPWALDGVAAGDPDQRRTDDVKLLADSSLNELRPDDGADHLEVDDTRDRFERVLATDLVESSGPDAVWRRTTHGGLFGLEVADLTLGEPAGTELAVDLLDRIRDSGRDRPRPMAEVVGSTSLPHGTVVAYAMNGTIGAVTEVEPGLDGNPGLAHGLVPPRLFRDGGNELQAFVVEGEVGSEILHPIVLSSAG